MVNLNNLAYYFINYKSPELDPKTSRFFLATRIFLGIFTFSISEWIVCGLKGRVKLQTEPTTTEDVAKKIFDEKEIEGSNIARVNFIEPSWIPHLRMRLKEIGPFKNAEYLEGFLSLAKRLNQPLSVENSYKQIENFTCSDGTSSDGKDCQELFYREFKAQHAFNRYPSQIWSFNDTSPQDTSMDMTEFEWLDGSKILFSQTPTEPQLEEYFQILRAKEKKHVIVLGVEDEDGKPKIFDYFNIDLPSPPLKDNSKEINETTTTTQPPPQKYGYNYASRSAPYAKREKKDYWSLELSNSKDEKLTIHRFPHWFDQEPIEPEALLKHCKRIDGILKENNHSLSDLLVHCSAGIGRTGVFTAALLIYRNYLEEKATDKTLLLNTAQVVLYLRAFRRAMVKNDKEFKLLCDTVELMYKK